MTIQRKDIVRRFFFRISVFTAVCVFVLSTTYVMLILHASVSAKLTLGVLYLILGVPLFFVVTLLTRHWVAKAAEGVSKVVDMEDDAERRMMADVQVDRVTSLGKRTAIAMGSFTISGFSLGSLLFYLIADVYWLEAAKVALVGIAITFLNIAGVLSIIWKDIHPKLMVVVNYTEKPQTHFNVKMGNRIGALFIVTSLSTMILIGVWEHRNEINRGLDVVLQRGDLLIGMVEQAAHPRLQTLPAQKLGNFEGLRLLDAQGKVLEQIGNFDHEFHIPIKELVNSGDDLSGYYFVQASMIGVVYAQLADGEMLVYAGDVRKAEAKERSWGALLFLVLIVLGFSFGIGTILGDLFAGFIAKLSAILSESTISGHFDQEIPIFSQDDIGLIAYNIQELYSRLNAYIGALLDTTRIIQDSLNEYTAFSQEVGTSSSEQSNALVEMSTTLEEIDRAARISSERSTHIQESAQRASELSLNMKSQMDRTYTNFEDLNQKTSLINDQVASLSRSASTVDEIVSDISVLAHQTGLLAINASVEAAKARDYGRGFGIVAREMKTLSGQSRRSSKSVQEKLNTIQKAVKEATTQVAQGKGISDRLKNTVFATQEAINLVVEVINKIDQIALQIATMANDQAIGIKQVVVVMNGIKTTSLKLAEGNAKLTEVFIRLHDMAGRLRDISFSGSLGPYP